MDWDGIRYFLEVARTQRVSMASKRLGVQHSTVSRRIQTLERDLGLLLFNKSRATGFTLTEDGQHFFRYAEQLESTLITACEKIAGHAQQLSGHLRVGCTEAFGSYILAPLMTSFQRRFPAITLDILPVPRFISLSKREADIAIALERPQRGPYLCTKLADYTLNLYGNSQYLKTCAPIKTRADLRQHTFIGYVEELLFSDRLRYLNDIAPGLNVTFKSTSVIAQYHAALHGQSLAILPAFMAAQNPLLQVVLENDVQVSRSFWMYCHEDLRHSKRVMALWDFLKTTIQLNQPLLKGTGRQIRHVDDADVEAP